MEKAITGKAEDYLRAVYEVIQLRGYTRINAIARELDVSPFTVVEMMRKLGDGGF